MNSIEQNARLMRIERNAGLKDVVATLVRRKWQILATFLTIVAGVTIVTFLMPKQYQSHMKILVKNERADVLVTADGSSGSSNRTEVSEEQINTEIALLNSNDLLQEIAVKSGLGRLETSSLPNANENQAVTIEKAVARLKKDLKIEPVRKANIIEIKYSAGDARLAAAVLRQLTESYLETHLRVHATPGTYEFFTKQAARYQDATRIAEEKMAEFRQKANIVMFPEEKSAMLQKASESESALVQAEATVREYQDKIANISLQLETTAIRVVTQSRTVPNQYSVDHLGTMLTELQNKRTQLLSKFLPSDRLVEEVNQQITDTQAALERAEKVTGVEEVTDANPVRETLAMEMAKEQAALAGIDARRQALAKQAQRYKQQLMQLGNTTADYNELARAQKEAEENYLLYTKKSEEARIAESLDQQKIANVAIAETPVEPQLPSQPNVPLNLTLGVLVAGFLSLAPALLALKYSREVWLELEAGPNRLDSARGVRHLPGLVEHPSDLGELTGLDVLATLDRPRPGHDQT
jgi:uncharacterized protein involved in exopolysaccharide biosynthesis